MINQFANNIKERSLKNLHRISLPAKVFSPSTKKQHEKKNKFINSSVKNIEQSTRKVSIKLDEIDRKHFSKLLTQKNLNGGQEMFLKAKRQSEADRYYKFSETVANTSDNKKQMALWISKRGSINFHLMENQDHIIRRFRIYGILDGNGEYGKQIAQYLGNRLLSEITEKGTEVFSRKRYSRISPFARKSMTIQNSTSNANKIHKKRQSVLINQSSFKKNLLGAYEGRKQNQSNEICQTDPDQSEEQQTKVEEYKKVITKIIEEENKKMVKLMPREVENSGCTLLMIIILDEHLYCFNVGTSKAILVRTIPQQNQEKSSCKQKQENKIKKKSKLSAVSISTEQTLSRFDQKARILSSSKALLEKSKDENGHRVGPLRIWKKGSNYPGISITRCLGMSLSAEQELGIISTPECLALKIVKNHKFIIMGSDGFWKVFFSNEQIIKIVEEYWIKRQMNNGLSTLMNEAVIRWNNKSELMDDISLMIIRL